MIGARSTLKRDYPGCCHETDKNGVSGEKLHRNLFPGIEETQKDLDRDNQVCDAVSMMNGKPYKSLGTSVRDSSTWDIAAPKLSEWEFSETPVGVCWLRLSDTNNLRPIELPVNARSRVC